jgi:uncharacterized metal-binding protein
MASSKHKSSGKCAECGLPAQDRICMSAQGKGPRSCPTLNARKLLAEANQEYTHPDTYAFAHAASVQEADCYVHRDQRPYVMQPSKTRMVEICEFAQKMGYRRLGLAFCIGLAKEAAVVERILEGHGFEVVSVVCKAGRTPKEAIGIADEDKIYRGTDEAMCNPIFQARLLNRAGTDFNIVLGLCVGHDALFFKHADSPTTVLAVKDRVTGHNPLAAIYLSDSYYRKIKRKQP